MGTNRRVCILRNLHRSGLSWNCWNGCIVYLHEVFREVAFGITFSLRYGREQSGIYLAHRASVCDFDMAQIIWAGPDCFTVCIELMGEAIDEFWHNQMVPNVHNEWFNALINYGIVGGMAYLGIFVSAAWAFMRKAVNDVKDTMDKALLFGAGLAAAGYVAHNVLCYQQIIGTPLIFVLLGIGAAIGRRR